MSDREPQGGGGPGVALVTGATGFVGSNLVRRLLREGWQVHIVARADSKLPTAPEFAQVTAHIHDGSTDSMVRLVADARPTVVFHLASLFLSGHTATDIVPLVQSNVLFATQLLEAMTQNGIKHFVNTGTSWQHYEDRSYSPVNLYAATKQAFDAILQYYVEARAVKAITLTLFDTYGRGDPRPKLFNLLAKAAETQAALAMSAGGQLIDLVYIDDVVDAYICAANIVSNAGDDVEVYAVSSGDPVPLRRVVSLYEQVAGVNLHIEWGKRPYREREVMMPWSRGKKIAGWSAKISLSDGIRRLFA